MCLKQILSIFIFTLLSACVSLKQKNSAQRDPSNLDEKHILQKRILELGQPTFIRDKKKSFSIQKHIKKQWALKDISFLEALKVMEKTTHKGCLALGKKKIKTECVAAVVDTGIHPTHPCLKNNLWINKGEVPNNGKDDDGNGFIDDVHGWNFVDNNNDIQDYHGHGTHISGIIAAQGETSKSPNCKVIGVAPHVRIMTVKYFKEGAGDSNIKNTVKAIKYAVDNGADIINYSGGGPGANNDEKSIIAKAADKKIILIAALGNEGSKIGKRVKYYPASYELPNIIYVQSQNKKNEIIRSSNLIRIESYEDKNKKVQTAPGHDIISTLPPRRYLQSYKEEKGFRSLASRAKWNNNYGLMTGTSQATAFATGLTALVKTRFPRWSMELVINQVTKTGYGQGTDKIKKATNQGKKLDAYKALTMRDQKINTIVDEPIPNPNDPEFTTRTEEEQKDYESNNPEKDTNFKILGNILKDMKNISNKKK